MIRSDQGRSTGVRRRVCLVEGLVLEAIQAWLVPGDFLKPYTYTLRQRRRMPAPPPPLPAQYALYQSRSSDESNDWINPEVMQ